MDDDLGLRFGIGNYSFSATYNAAPTQTLPVVVDHPNGKRIELMKWGLIPVWAKDEKIGYKLINARSETVFEKNTWKKVITNQRCLVPATGFYEWKKAADGKRPFYIHKLDQPIMSFAGVWSSWKSSEGNTLHSYAILTTAPNKEMSVLHDRMPVILHPEDEQDWLNPDMTEQQDIAQFLRPLEDGSLDIYEVSTAVNNVRVNNESLVRPVSTL